MPIRVFSRVSLALAVVFLTILAMTIWWQMLFSKTIENYFYQAEIRRLENKVLRILQSRQSPDELLQENYIQITEDCRLEPCIQNGNITYEITPIYRAELKNLEKRKVNMIYWETSFLMFFLFLGILYLGWAVRRERRAEREKKEFLALTTHELKHPISVVSLVLESLKRDVLPAEKKQEFLDKGMAELRDLKKSLENILKIQEFDFEKSAKVKSYDFSAQLSQIYQYWKMHKLNDPDRINFENKTPLQTSVHPKLLEIILNNLIENALLYSEEGIILQSGKDSKGYFIQVQDFGLGFTNEEKKNFQKMFYRSNRHEIQNKGGTGLGHFIVKKLSLRAGISIFLDSPGENKGSIFKVYLR